MLCLRASLSLALPIGLGLMGPSISRTLSISRAIDFSWEPTPGHATSMPMSLVNPKGCKIESDRYSMSISLDKLKPDMTDEEILANFTKGFFGGWVFAFERYICLALRAVFDFNAHRLRSWRSYGADSSQLQPIIWDWHDIPTEKPLPLGSSLFGIISLLDSSIPSVKEREKMFPNGEGTGRPSFALLEFAGHTEQSRLVASHRFKIVREASPKDKAEVQIIFSHVRSNPRTGGAVLPGILTYFHVLYSALLFSDGVQVVLAS